MSYAGLGNHCPTLFALLLHDSDTFYFCCRFNKVIHYQDIDRYTAFHLLLQLPMFLQGYSCLHSLQNNLQPFEIHSIYIAQFHAAVVGDLILR